MGRRRLTINFLSQSFFTRAMFPLNQKFYVFPITNKARRARPSDRETDRVQHLMECGPQRESYNKMNTAVYQWVFTETTLYLAERSGRQVFAVFVPSDAGSWFAVSVTTQSDRRVSRLHVYHRLLVHILPPHWTILFTETTTIININFYVIGRLSYTQNDKLHNVE